MFFFRNFRLSHSTTRAQLNEIGTPSFKMTNGEPFRNFPFRRSSGGQWVDLWFDVFLSVIFFSSLLLYHMSCRWRDSELGRVSTMMGGSLLGPRCCDGSSGADVRWWWLFVVKMAGRWSNLAEGGSLNRCCILMHYIV